MLCAKGHGPESVVLQVKERETQLGNMSKEVQTLQKELDTMKSVNKDLRAQLTTQTNLTVMQAQLDQMQASVLQTPTSHLLSSVKTENEDMLASPDSELTKADMNTINADNIKVTSNAMSNSEVEEAEHTQGNTFLQQRSSNYANDIEVEALAAIARARSLTPARRFSDNASVSSRSSSQIKTDL